MDNTTLHTKFGSRMQRLSHAAIECLVAYPVVLAIASPDRTQDNPIRVYLRADHAIRLIKDLASSALADMK